MRIAVLGGGNGSFAAAGDFALAVTTCGCGGVMLGGASAQRERHHHGEGFSRAHTAKPSLITNDIAAAVRDAELILCPAPAMAQADIARALAPHLKDGQSCSCRRHVRLLHFRESRTRCRQPC